MSVYKLTVAAPLIMLLIASLKDYVAVDFLTLWALDDCAETRTICIVNCMAQVVTVGSESPLLPLLHSL